MQLCLRRPVLKSYSSLLLNGPALIRHERKLVCIEADKKGGSVLSWVSPDNKADVQRILELADRAVDRWDVTVSDFLTPSVLADALVCLRNQANVKVQAWGGYPQAERCRLLVGREEVMTGDDDPALSGSVAVLDVRGNFMFDPASHKDFLGACLGTGVVRERVGDVLVQGESGAQILVDPLLVEHFTDTLKQVRTVPVTTTAVALSELRVSAPRTQEISSVEASLRIDAVASAGFRISRSKMVSLVGSGDVRVNWKAVTKAGSDVKQGDVISCTGHGRLEIKEVVMTKKEKYVVKMVRYV